MKKPLRSALLALITLLFITSCASTGKAKLDLARKALDENRPAAALVHATESLMEDPEYDNAKAFLRDNAEKELGLIKGFLNESESSRVPEVVEKRYDTYGNLVDFYANLKKIGLPLVQGKKLFGLIKGWQWSIPLEDYTTAYASEKVKARDVFLESGYASIEEGELNRAEALLKKVITKFAEKGSPQLEEDRKAISEKFSGWAVAFHGSTDPDVLLKAIKAYSIALNFDKENQEALSGKTAMELELSDVYLALGLEEERLGTVESLKEAINYFELALKYNSDNSAASEGIPRAKHQIAVLLTDQGISIASSGKVEDMITAHGLFESALQWESSYAPAQEEKTAVTERIAEYYYQEGQRYGANLKDDEALKAGIAAFDNAEKWIAGYKNTGLMKQRLYVSRQVINLEQKLAVTIKEYERTNSRVVSLSKMVNKGHQGIEDLFYVSDKIIQLDEQMQTIKVVMSPMGSLPFVGPVFTTTGTVLGRSHKPVAAASSKVKKVQRPYITPSREMMKKVKAKVDQIKSTMGEVKGSLESVRQTVIKLNKCIQTVENEAVMKEVERDAKEISKILDKLNNGLDTVNDAQDSVEGTMKALADSVGTISKVTGGIKKIMRPLDKIDSVTSEIKKVFDKKIKIPLVGSFTVGEAIESSTGVVKKAAEKILNPLIDKLNINIPSIPGIDELDKTLDDVEGYYGTIKDAEAKIRKATDQILGVPDELQARVNSIAEKTGCTF